MVPNTVLRSTVSIKHTLLGSTRRVINTVPFDLKTHCAGTQRCSLLKTAIHSTQNYVNNVLKIDQVVYHGRTQY